MPEERYGMQKMKIGHQHTGSNLRTHLPSKEVPAEIGSTLEVTWLDKRKKRQKAIGNFLCVRQTGRKEQSLILVQGVTDGIIPTQCYCIPIEYVRELRAFISKKDREVEWKRVKAIFDDTWKRLPEVWKTEALGLRDMGYSRTKTGKIVMRYLASNLDTGESLVVGKTEWIKVPLTAYKEYMYLPEPTLERLRRLTVKIQTAELKEGRPIRISESKVKHLATIYGLNQLEKMSEAEILELINKLPS